MVSGAEEASLCRCNARGETSRYVSDLMLGQFYSFMQMSTLRTAFTSRKRATYVSRSKAYVTEVAMNTRAWQILFNRRRSNIKYLCHFFLADDAPARKVVKVNIINLFLIYYFSIIYWVYSIFLYLIIYYTITRQDEWQILWHED